MPSEITEMLTELEGRLRDLVSALSTLPGDIYLAPDNLDGQFIAPGAFDAHLVESYRRSADVIHASGRALVVHVGGPVRRLLPRLAEAGVDGVEGIAGPPHGDLTLCQAEEAVGSRCALWGGIPQDMLLPTHSRESFESAVLQAAAEARAIPRAVLGVADRVPVDAGVKRLLAIPTLVS